MRERGEDGNKQGKMGSIEDTVTRAKKERKAPPHDPFPPLPTHQSLSVRVRVQALALLLHEGRPASELGGRVKVGDKEGVLGHNAAAGWGS